MESLKKGVRTRGAHGRHFYQFYRGKEDFFRIVLPFLRLGLENKEACLWIVSDSIGTVEAVHAFQRQYDFSPFIESGQLLIVSAERWYLNREGRFSESQALEKAKKFIQDKQRLGFTAFRGVGDAGWVENSEWFKFQSYEEKIHRWISDLQITVICAYPIQRCSITQTQDVLDSHHGVFLTKL